MSLNPKNIIIKESELDKAKDAFLSTISHELRTPLNGIMGIISIFPDAGPLNKKQEEYIRNLTECAVHLTSLLNNILDFSKMTSNRMVLQKKSFNVSDAVKKAYSIAEGRALSKGLDINIDIKNKIPLLLGDEQRLIQILTNLLVNAIKFTDKGYINLTVIGERIKDLSSEDNLCPQKRYKVLFKVKDTGIGIPAKEQNKIFEMFNQSLYMNKIGMGLGLSIVKELTKLMNGEITVSSSGKPGKGSTFTFYIILDEEIDINKLKSVHGELLYKSKILIVDDRPEIRLQLTEMLFKWKCIPQAVANAEEALQYLSHGTEYDVALIDICMPYMSGVELAQELRRKYPNLPLIGISSINLSNGEEYFDHYMYKPIDQNRLFPAL